MRTLPTQLPTSLCIACAIGAAGALLGSLWAAEPLVAPGSLGNTSDFQYARLVFTVAPQSTTVWINTPVGAATASIGKGTGGTLDAIQEAIRATDPAGSYDTLGTGLAVDDMVLMQWMGLANWELAAVTQNQIDQGSTTSYFFKRAR